jgi:hypothetical protein
MVKLPRLLVLCLLLATILSGRLAYKYYRQFVRPQTARETCRSQLEVLHFLLDRYAREHGAWPGDPQTALLESEPYMDQGYTYGSYLACAGTETVPGSLADAATWTDFIYIDWTRYFGKESPPDYYPLMYDRRIANHGGGVNVLLVSGSVIWDRPREWARVPGYLSSFAYAHPEYDIPMPQ